MSNWDKVGKYSGGGSDFLKMKAGEKCRIHFVSTEPRVVFQVYDNVGKKNANLQEGYKLPDGIALRVQHAFLVFNITAAKIQVLAMSDTTCEKLKEIYESYNGSLDTVDIDMKRQGEGFDTEYFLTPVPTTFDKSMIDGVELPDLDRIYKPANQETIDAVIQAILAGGGVKEKKTKKTESKKEAAPAAAPQASTTSLDELDLPQEPATKPTTTRVGVRKEARTEADMACPTCKVKRDLREGTVKTMDPETNLPWGKVKALVCKPCNKLDVIEKLPDPVPAMATA